MRKPVIAALVGLLGLAACANTTPVATTPSAVSGADQSAVAAYFAQTLRDPYSAQYRGWNGYNLSQGGRVICGEMNARNGFGGFTGFKPFYVRMDGDSVRADLSEDQAAMACRDAASGQFMISQ